MATHSYQRTIDQLEGFAVKWWPTALVEREADTSVIPALLQSLDSFLSILTLAKKRPDHIFELIDAAGFAGNLFLKHLCVLSNVGGEPLMRINRDIPNLFPKDPNDSTKHIFRFTWGGSSHSYVMGGLPMKGLSNSKLNVDAASLIKVHPLDASSRDIIMLLLHGAAAMDPALSDGPLSECEVGGLLGQREPLEDYLRTRYIHVSRITGGAKANTLGQVAQSYVKEVLSRMLDTTNATVRGGKIQLSNGESEVFDIVIDCPTFSIGVEVSFQVTTNSTIERKASQAELRYAKLHNDGHFVAYVIDGAGNFARSSAITKICNSSDCTIAFSDSEFQVLVDFVTDHL